MSDELIPRPAGPAAGWYPAGNGYERWWDGLQWTDAHRQLQQVYQPVPQAYQPAVQSWGGGATDQRHSGVEVFFAWTFAVLTLLYMLPWAIAATRGKSNSVGVALVNLFLGWTFIGWFAALIMACSAHQQRMNVVQVVNAPHYPQGGHY